MGVMGHKLVSVFECILTIFGMVASFIANYSLGFIDITITFFLFISTLCFVIVNTSLMSKSINFCLQLW